MRKLLLLFRQYGYEGATLTRISEATGLGRASLYHHFPKGKEEMATAVLEYVDRWMAENILNPLKADGNPGDRLQNMVTKVNALYESGGRPCILAALSMGDSHDLFYRQIQTALQSWIDAISQVLIDDGIDAANARLRAENAILQIQGALILSRGLNNTAPFQRVLQQLPDELLQPVRAS